MINMTNVEYIDYFEKIIANEPENILSLYFVQKLMSDVRFRSFQPMISAELQKKILKMVLPKLKNQFKTNRLVDFNPIGVADEEIEILNKESVTDVGTFVKTLDDGKVCKEIENLQIDKVSFYCLRVVYEGKCVYLLRQFSKMKKLRSGLLTHFINDELVEMESDFLGLDEDVDMVLCEDSLVILNHISLERIFNYRDAYKAKTDEAMGAILTQGVLVNIEQFADDCSRDVRIMKRFTNIMSKGRLPLFFDNYDNLLSFLNLLIILYSDIISLYNGVLDIHLKGYINEIAKYKNYLSYDAAKKNLELVYSLVLKLQNNVMPKNILNNLFVNIF